MTRLHKRMAAAVLAVVLGRGAIAPAADDAVAPRLEEIERSSSTPAAAEPNDAQPVPVTVTICQDERSQRCWTEAGATTCGSEGTSSRKVFRRTSSNSDPGQALEACWAALRR